MAQVTNMKNLPVGTHIVTEKNLKTPVGLIRQGSVGVVKEHIDSSFLVELPDRRKFVASEEDISCRRTSFRGDQTEVSLDFEQISPYIEFRFIAGSTAYGLRNENSDEDFLGCYILPPQAFFGIREFQETVVTSKPDGSFHEIKKLIVLACKGNPNIMELAEISKIPELVVQAPTNPFVIELLQRWDELFLTKNVFTAYQGYAIAQFKKIKQSLENNHDIRWKHACHLLRLLWSGIQCMQQKRIILRPKDHDIRIHEKLMAVRHGQMTLDQFEQWRLDLEKQFQDAFDKTDLPLRPKEKEANQLLVDLRSKLF